MGRGQLLGVQVPVYRRYSCIQCVWLGLNQIQFTLDIREKGDKSLDTLSISNIWPDERSRTIHVIFIYNDFMHNEQYLIVPNKIIHSQEEILINRLTTAATENLVISEAL